MRKYGNPQPVSILKLFSFALLLLTAFNSSAQIITSPEFLWLKEYPTSSFYRDISETVIQTTEGGYLIGSSSYSEPGGEKTAAFYGHFDYWAIKTDSNGNRVWDQSSGGTGPDSLRVVIEIPEGGWLLAGTSYSPVSGNKTAPFKSSSYTDGDFWIVKLSADGTKVWDLSFGGTADDKLTDAILTRDGGYLLGGFSNSPATFDKSENPKTGPTAAGKYFYDYWVIKVDKNGVKVWDKIFGGAGDLRGSLGHDYLMKIIEMEDGGYLLAGSSNSNQGNDKSDNRRCIACENPDADYWLIKMDEKGNKLWDKTFGGSGDDNLRDVARIPGGGVILAGNSNSSLSFDKTEEPPAPDSNEVHAWLLNISDNGTKVWDRIYYHPYIPGETEDYRPLLVTSVHASSHGYFIGTMAGVRKYLSSEETVIFSWEGVKQWNYIDQLARNAIYPVKLLKNGPTDELVFATTGEELYAHCMLFKYKLRSIKKTLDFSIEGFTDRFFINIINQEYQPNLEKVEFYFDSLKVGEDSEAPFNYEYLDGSRRLVGAHYLHVKYFFKGGASVRSPTKPFNFEFKVVSLYRAINVNGTDIQTSYISYSSGITAADFEAIGRKFQNQKIPLSPVPDSTLSTVIRSCVYSTKNTPSRFTFSNVAKGYYEVYAYIWEDNFPTSFQILINGTAAGSFSSVAKGAWAKIGPFNTSSASGKIEISAKGGDANISAIELWRLDEVESFYKAINVNGQDLRIDNLLFESSANTPNFSFIGKAFENQYISLNYPADRNRGKMIRSSIYSTSTYPSEFVFSNVPEGDYIFYTYSWEDNYPSRYQIWVNDRSYVGDMSGDKGKWKITYVAAKSVGGKIKIKAIGGDYNISGFEIWKRKSSATSTHKLESESYQSKAFPNPVNNHITLETHSIGPGKVNIQLLDVFGKILWTEEHDLGDEGLLTLDLPTTIMKKGLYFLKLNNGKQREAFRLYKE